MQNQNFTRKTFWMWGCFLTDDLRIEVFLTKLRTRDQKNSLEDNDFSEQWVWNYPKNLTWLIERLNIITGVSLLKVFLIDFSTI